MTNEDPTNLQDHNIKSTDENTPQNVIANGALFNRQFINFQLGGNPASVSIGKMLTVMSEQDNTIRVLSRILGRDYNEQHLHDMHNSLFGGLESPSGGRRESMHLGNLLTQLTTFIHEQHQQIEGLIDEVRKNVKQVTNELQE